MPGKKIISLILSFLLLLSFSVVVSAAQAEEPPREVTLEEAVGLALTRSNVLEKADWEKKQKEEDKDDAFDLLLPHYQGDLPVINYFGAKLKDIIADLSYEQQVDAVEYDTREKYFGVLLAERELLSAKDNLALQHHKLNNVQIGTQVGTQNRIALLQAQTDLLSAQEAVKQQEDNLANAYKSFNITVGFDPESRPVLVDVPEYSPLDKEMTVDDFVKSSQNDNPAIEMAQAAADVQKKLKGMDTYKKGDFEKAYLDLQIAIEGTEEGVRNLYYQVRALEGQYDSLMENRGVLEENLRIKQIMFDVGMATKTEVLEAQSSLAELDKNIFAVVINHDLLKELLLKPWAVSSRQMEE